MYENTILEPISSELRLSLNLENVDRLFPGFMLGDFAVLYGSSTIKSLIFDLCVRAQLPCQLGGLSTNVLFVDGDNSFRLYSVSTLAQRYELDPREVLGRIFISRAFTVYQHVSLLFEKLEKAIEKYDSKLVILSKPFKLYLNQDVQKQEAEEVFIQLTDFLSDFAKENQVIVIATQPSHFWSKRSSFFKEVMCRKANVVASIRKFSNRPNFVLQKHSLFKSGKVELSSGNVTLLDFMVA